MASVNWMKLTNQRAGSLRVHLDNSERATHGHSNKQIDRSKTDRNYMIGCESFDDALESLRLRTAAVDAAKPPKRIRSDRKIAVSLEFVCPAEIEAAGRAEEFFGGAYKTIQQNFGSENVHGAFVHLDEQHEYTDRGGVQRMSLQHAHVLVSCYTEKSGINGKSFVTKASLNKLNCAMNDYCRREFGMEYNTGQAPQRKSVEELKAEQPIHERIDPAAEILTQAVESFERSTRLISTNFDKNDLPSFAHVEQIGGVFNRREAVVIELEDLPKLQHYAKVATALTAPREDESADYWKRPQLPSMIRSALQEAQDALRTAMSLSSGKLALAWQERAERLQRAFQRAQKSLEDAKIKLQDLAQENQRLKSQIMSMRGFMSQYRTSRSTTILEEYDVQHQVHNSEPSTKWSRPDLDDRSDTLDR